MTKPLEFGIKFIRMNGSVYRFYKVIKIGYCVCFRQKMNKQYYLEVEIKLLKNGLRINLIRHLNALKL